MKNTTAFIIGIIAIIIGVVILWAGLTYNSLVNKQEAVKRAWAQVENVCQRRAELVPNLVALVKDYTEYEQGTLLAVTEARAKAANATVNTETFDENEFVNYEAAQKELDNSLNRLIVEVENYPDLKANEEYLILQAQLAGCENRIQIERERFNKAGRDYNIAIRKFPTNLIAKLFGFEECSYFKADEGTEKVPETF